MKNAHDTIIRLVQYALQNRNSSIESLKRKLDNECTKTHAIEQTLVDTEAELSQAKKSARLANEARQQLYA